MNHIFFGQSFEKEISQCCSNYDCNGNVKQMGEKLLQDKMKKKKSDENLKEVSTIFLLHDQTSLEVLRQASVFPPLLTAGH